jgi:GTP-binding protein EngB required for normal cell division
MNSKNFDRVSERKNELSEATTLLLRLSKDRSSQRLQEQAIKLGEKLSSFTFNLLVIGEFKRGKSTLINALVGAPILPTAAVPLTSVATIVRYGDTAKAQISFFSGEKAACTLESLPDFVTERGNPSNAKRVRLAEVQYPAEILNHGICIVDTPGTGSVYLHNTQTTYDFLPEADAAVFVFVADQPATRAELDLLKTSRQFSAYHFYVLNKTDYLDDESKCESSSFLKQTLETELGEVCTIYPMSAKVALLAKTHSGESSSDLGFMQFERSLLDFAVTEKTQVLLQSVTTKLELLVRETEQLIELELVGMSMPQARLEECIRVFNDARSRIVQEEEDAAFIVKGEIQKIVKTVGEDLRPIVEEHTASLQAAIAHEYELQRSLSKDELIEHLRSSLKQRISAVFDNWRKSEESKIVHSFELLNGRFVERGNRIISDIERLTEELFDVKVRTYFEIEGLENKDRHFYAVGNPFTLSLEVLPLLLPAVLAKNIIRARFIEAAQHELSRNAGRLRADYQERLEASGRSFLQNFHNKISRAMEEIELVIRRAYEQQQLAASVKQTVETRLQSQSELNGSIRTLLSEH